MAIRYLADLETAKIDMGGNELRNAVIHPLDTLSRPVSPSEGQVFFNTTSKLLELWNGTAWLEIPNTLSGQVNFPSYGVGAYQGTGNYFITIDASGNLIENTSITPLSNGAIVNGALNIIDLSSGESILYGHSGIIAQQNLDSTFSFADGTLTIDSAALELKFLNQEVHFGFVNTNYIPVKANVGYTTSPVHVDPNNSYVSINNTNPTASFDVLGSVRFRSYGAGNLTSIVGESTFPAFDIAGNIVESQLITTDGTNIGIGITNPERKLHVVGTTRPALFGSDNAVNIVKFYNSATGKNSLQGFDIVVNSTASAQLSAYNLPLIFAVSNAANTAASPALTINKDKSIKFDAYGTGGVTGTESTFPAFTSNGNIIESQLITTDGSSITINGNLNVTEGNAYLYGGVQALRLSKGTDTIYTNTIGGYLAGSPSSTRQTVFGTATGQGNTGVNQSAFGYFAGYVNTGANQSAFGYLAGRENIGDNQSAFGYLAGRENTGANQSAFGYAAGYLNTGADQSAFGFQAGYLNEGDNTVMIGYQAGRENTTDNIFILKQNNVNTTSLIEGNFLSGQVAFRNYGTGTISGTESTFPAFDASGNIIETDIQGLLAKTPSYTDNASALAGGLSVGDTYYNNLLNTYTRVI